MKLSILILTTQDRKEFLQNLKDILTPQTEHYKDEVEVLIRQDDMGVKSSIGLKRNALLKEAVGDYVCFVDDDDEVSPDYVKNILEAIQSNPDCVSITGIITWDGVNPEVFEHSIKYNEYKTTNNDIKYERYPNHLNPIKREIAQQFSYKLISHGEDTDWATQVHNSGLLKTEVKIDEIMYHYLYRSNK